METGKNCFNLLVLVPHRDTRLPLKAWSASLFAAGLDGTPQVPGAWSFPWVIPLAQVRRPLLTDELKALAADLRTFLNSGDDKFTGAAPAGAALPGCPGWEAWGPVLNTELPGNFFETVSDAVVCRISPLVLGCALVKGSVPNGLPVSPEVSFRAAALANMECCFQAFEESGFSFEWKIGKLQWLPKQMKNVIVSKHSFLPRRCDC